MKFFLAISNRGSQAPMLQQSILNVIIFFNLIKNKLISKNYYKFTITNI